MYFKYIIPFNLQIVDKVILLLYPLFEQENWDKKTQKQKQTNQYKITQWGVGDRLYKPVVLS